jgi:hypothetical protein
MSLSLCVSAQDHEGIRLFAGGDDMGSFASINQSCIDASAKGIVKYLDSLIICIYFAAKKNDFPEKSSGDFYPLAKVKK